MLRIELLGGFRLLDEGKPGSALDWTSVQGLLGYLLLHRAAAVPRQQVAFALWPDSPEPQALGNLRTLLVRLRSLWPAAGEYVETTRRTLHWRPDGAYHLDVDEFEAALRRARQAHRSDPASAQAALGAAVAVYRGDLLPALYSEWVLPERERLRRGCLQALQQLVSYLETDGDYDRALGYAQQWLQAEPLDEVIYQGLMRLHAGRGDRAGVLRVFNTCQTVLERELATEPSPATRALFDKLSREPLPGPSPATARPHLVGRLSRPLTSFVGRRAALATLRELLSAARLITLTGPGGSGKTRLALEVALSVQGNYSDGVWWVDLSVAAPRTAVLPFVAAAMDVRDQPERATLDVVIEFLAPRAALMVLDNCEHVIAEAAGISRHLLVSCPRLTILITGRETLNLTGEAAWPVPPLELAAAAGEALPEAVQLFVERAALVLPTFALTAQNRTSVEYICRTLDGLPLAIELAAARLKLLAPQQLADHLRDRFTWLQNSDRTVQPRHRTLAALVAWSYDLLPPAEQALLQGLSIFASRFSLATAEAVVGTWLAERQAPLIAPLVEVLARLVDKSLVGVEGQTGPVAHYRLLETIRQFGAERLAEAGGAQAVGQRCLAYYTAWAEAAEAGLVGPDQETWLASVAGEHDNLRGALAWAQAHGAAEAGLRLAGALWLFWHQHGHWREGHQWLEGFLSAATGSAPEARSKAYDGLGVLLWRLGDAAQAGHVFDAALALLRPQGNTAGLSRVLAHQGLMLDGLGDNAGARQAYTEGLAISRALGDKPGIARALHNLGNLAVMQDQRDEALRYYEECLALYREWDDRSGIALLSLGLGTIAQEQGDWARARAMFVQSRDLARQVGDQLNEAMAIWGLGKAALEAGEAAQGAELLQDSLLRFEALGNADGVAAAQTALGRARLAQGDTAGAADLLHAGLRGHQAVGNMTGVAEGLEGLGALAAATGQPEHAVRLLAAGAQMRVTLQRPLPPLEAGALEAIHEGLRTHIGAAAFQAAWSVGEGLSHETALAEALAVSGRA